MAEPRTSPALHSRPPAAAADADADADAEPFTLRWWVCPFAEDAFAWGDPAARGTGARSALAAARGAGFARLLDAW